MVQCVSVETSQKFGMELVSLSLLSLLLLGCQPGSGGIIRLFMMLINNFSPTPGLFQFCFFFTSEAL